MGKCGCYIGNRFIGALSYADDLCLIAPSRNGLKNMLKICDVYAKEYSLAFNSDKSSIVVFNNSSDTCNVEMTLNNKVINVNNVSQHLGIHIGKNNDNDNVQKGVNDLITRTNYVMAKFSMCNYLTRAKLFNTYCTSYYGSPLWNLNNIDNFYCTWRKCIRRVWNIPNRTHNRYLPYIHDVTDVQSQLLSRFASFYYDTVHSNNPLVRLCQKLSMASNSNVGCNLRHLMYKLNDNSSILSSKTKQTFRNAVKARICLNQDSITCTNGSLIRELCLIRDHVLTCPFDGSDVQTCIEELCVN